MRRTRIKILCFSPTASFTLGSAPIPPGILCAVTAYKNNKKFFFSLIPLFFGIQQCTEDFIWWLRYYYLPESEFEFSELSC
jgi:hypothetical protein